jgi:hypothetical protein
MTKALLVTEVVTQVQLDGVKAQPGKTSQLILDPAAAHPGRRIIQRVRDDNCAAARLTGKGRQVIRMIAHPER